MYAAAIAMKRSGWATVAGTPVGKAQQALVAAEQMDANPVLGEACRAGKLSADQAGEIANVVKENPGSAGHLIDTAAKKGFKGLKHECRAVARQAASAQDDQERVAAIHRSRYLRTWVDADGVGRVDGRMTAGDLARFNSMHHPYVERAFKEARREGKREKPECYALDALLDMAADRSGAAAAVAPSEDEPYDDPDPVLFDEEAPPSPPLPRRAGAGPPKTIVVLVDRDALIRGHTEDGETCLIRGIGPVPVTTVRAWLDEAFLAVVDKGIDIRRVTHLGRSATAAQRTALYARDLTCVVPGCDTDTGLEIDHVTG